MKLRPKRHLFPADHNFDEAQVIGVLQHRSGNTIEGLNSLIESAREEQRERAKLQWLVQSTVIPSSLDKHIGDLRTYILTKDAYSRGAHLALHGVSLGDSRRVTTKLTPKVVALHYPVMALGSIWGARQRAASNEAIATLEPMHQRIVEDWAYQQYGQSSNVGQAEYFRRGFASTLHMARLITNHEAAASYNEDMQQWLQMKIPEGAPND